MRPKFVTGKKSFLILILVLSILVFSTVPGTSAAPSGQITLGPEITVDNYLAVGDSETPTIVFKNTAETITDVASTVQYLAVSVAVRNPTKISIALSATLEIHDASNLLRAGPFTVSGVKASSSFIPPGPVVPAETVDLYTWSLGQPFPDPSGLTAYTDSNQFDDYGDGDDLRVLRPGEFLYLTITVTCLDEGDSIAWFFFSATEDAYASGSYPTDIATITDKTNIYYSKLPGPSTTKYWLPLHNSYDPYDVDISSGHVFDQTSWNRNPTNTAYAKTNKVFHQGPPANGDGKSTIHICGLKFDDANRDGIYDVNNEGTVNGIQISLLGSINPDTLASVVYSGKFSYDPPDADTIVSGENGAALSGAYCFNLKDVVTGSYTFYIRINEPTGRIATTPTLIGPITFNVDNSPAAEFYDVGNSFGNMLSTDYGDAPDPLYPTYLSSDGARHTIGNIWMGSIVDGESDGQPTDQDDAKGADDEDGVTFPGAPWVVGETGTIRIVVSGVFEQGQTGYLHGWIDWNQDGDWNDPNENLFSGYAVSAPGTYTFNFQVPVDAVPGSTWTRFRLDDQDLNQVTGLADNGEVEDYFLDPVVRQSAPPRPSYPVGGVVAPANKIVLIAPYLALIGLMGAAYTTLALTRRKRGRG